MTPVTIVVTVFVDDAGIRIAVGMVRDYDIMNR